MHRHDLAHPDVARDAIRVLLDPEAGESAQDLAMVTLRGVNVAIVTDYDIVRLADRAMTEGHARRLVWAIEKVHEYRGLAPKFLCECRDRLAMSDDPHVRAAALDVAALLPGLDVAFAHLMFADSSPLVRAGVADLLAKAQGDARTTALLLVEDHVDQEEHASVLSACHYCMGALVGALGRRPRSVDATHEGEG